MFGKHRGIIWFGIPLLYWIVAGAIVGGVIVSSQGGAGAPCFAGARPCQYGYSCEWTGNPLGGLYQCVAHGGVGGELERLLYQFSLNNLVCGGGGLLSGACSLSLVIVSAVIVAALGFVLAVLFAGASAGVVGAVLGGIVGVGLNNFVQLFWWVLLLIAGVIWYLTKK